MVLLPVPVLAADQAERISVSSAGAQGTGTSTTAAISADGRYVAFVSLAPNLVPGDTNGRQDVFVRDRSTGETSRVSVSSAGTQAADGNVIDVAISSDGRYVAFVSTASNLVPGDAFATYDAFVHDRSLGTTSRVAATADVEISGDGRFVVTVGPVGSSHNGVLVHDRTTGTTTVASILPDGSSPTTSAQLPAISADGRFVAFQASTPAQAYVRDMLLGQTVRVSVATDGTPGNQGSSHLAVSGGGRFVAFHSLATNLVPADTNGVRDTFVHDTVTGATTRVNVSSGGSQANNVLSNDDGRPSISADGRYVAFSSTATNLVAGDTSSVPDVFVHDRLTHETTRVSVSSTGAQANHYSVEPAISADGSYVAFSSRASNLVAGDTNGLEDIFVRQLTTADGTPPEVSYTLTPAAPDGDNGWYRSDVELGWTVADGQSPAETVGCIDRSITADQPKTDYSCTATSAGGTTGPVSVTIGRDTTQPVVDTTVVPAAPDGDNGWYVSPVTLAYGCTDATSGVASCPQDLTVGEGASQLVQTSGADEAGNTRSVSSEPYDVDLTDPVVTCRTEPAFLVGQPGNVSATVSDPMSGPAAPLVTADVDTSSVGSALAPLAGADVAGRTATVNCGYRVHYGFSGFQAPVDTGAVNVAKAGTAVPLKWRLTDHAGAPIVDLTSVRVTSTGHACDGGAAEDAIEEVAPGASGLQNLGDGNYQLNWKSPKTYAGTCRTLQLDLGEGLLHTAEFRFKA
ncbi:MAG TPA: PxKF domain-containing protein [Nocardioidaceae bacterium]|nr:PxKF domain-containing protein [Nocardioidaceae bacterium]